MNKGELVVAESVKIHPNMRLLCSVIWEWLKYQSLNNAIIKGIAENDLLITTGWCVCRGF
ncbi:hypothetical protein [endosymbiont 'TC1' of Trimyema compressum]|uniref:hypothetical protein n=1 Tax=endosymbiont 'TC1' of Trimyema compressum TaxID=243899 RepID=UPI0013923B4D|nr:hypothetical protein [endosymbiont 'TC1' of Trimyema compressum]